MFLHRNIFEFRTDRMKIHHFEEIDSTNDHLADMAEKGAAEWTAVLADRQTSGKGRQNRSWWSPPGNLHMSVLVKPEASSRELMRLPVIASLAFVSAMGAHGSPLVIKWPNDIVYEGRKMAGILVETRSEGKKVLWAVVGFGVNMVRDEGSIPEYLAHRLAFVQEIDESLDRQELAARILAEMREWSGSLTGDAWTRARKEWMSRALLNTPYTLRDGPTRTEGVPVGLDDFGGLIMETGQGKITVYSGELENKPRSKIQNPK